MSASLRCNIWAEHGADRFRADFERATKERRAPLRIEAARGIARYDRQRGTALLLREFDSRFINACQSANEALSGLSGITRSVDCKDPTARRQAKEEWTRELVATTVTSAR